MKKKYYTVAAWITFAVVVSSGLGWYWHELLECLVTPIHDVRLGPALFWCVGAAVLVRFINRALYRSDR